MASYADRPRLRSWDKVLWLLGRRLCADWRRHLALVTPDTVVRWHREGWRRRRHDLEARIEALARQARELEAEATRRVDLTQAISHVEVFCRRVREGLAAATFEEKRQLVELLIDRVVVTDEQVEIRHGVPTSSGGEQTRFRQLRLDHCDAKRPMGSVAGSWSGRSHGSTASADRRFGTGAGPMRTLRS